MPSPMVRYRVYWVSLFCPDWPSFFSCSKRGITTINSWMMMLAVMYGMIPRAKIDSFNSAPPENSWISAYVFLLEPLLMTDVHALMPLVDTPGAGTLAPSRNNATKARVKSSFLRRSGVRNADANAESTDPPARALAPQGTSGCDCNSRGRPHPSRRRARAAHGITTR